MNVVVLFESLKGNTRRAAELIGGTASSLGAVVVVRPLDDVVLDELARADVVFAGSWTDGLFFFGQRPAKAAKFRRMPTIVGKRAAVFCTYALDPGKTLEKLADIVADRGGEVIDGLAIRSDDLEKGVADFVADVLATASV